MTEPHTAMTQTPKQNPQRRRALLRLSAVLLAAAIVLALYWFFCLYGKESTDDAYAAGNLIPVSAQVGGTIVAIGAEDTQTVKAGQLLVRLDDADARLAVERARAELAQVVRQTRVLITGEQKLEAVLAERKVALARAEGDLARRQAASADDAIGKEELQHAKEAVDQQRAALRVAEAELKAQREMVMSDAVARHPQVARAAAALKAAALELERTRVPAPAAGQIARRSAQVGMRIQPGAPLMALVPMNTLWVDANFKESQLAKLRVGQQATVTADLYGDKVEYRGKVVGVSAGTGSAFSLLPPQNATGNWIKVVQRVPVRIELEPEALARHPLRIGLSMNVTVDTSDQGGVLALSAPVGKPAYATAIYDGALERANALVAATIAANAGQ